MNRFFKSLALATAVISSSYAMATITAECPNDQLGADIKVQVGNTGGVATSIAFSVKQNGKIVDSGAMSVLVSKFDDQLTNAYTVMGKYKSDVVALFVPGLTNLAKGTYDGYVELMPDEKSPLAVTSPNRTNCKITIDSK